MNEVTLAVKELVWNQKKKQNRTERSITATQSGNHEKKDQFQVSFSAFGGHTHTHARTHMQARTHTKAGIRHLASCTLTRTVQTDEELSTHVRLRTHFKHTDFNVINIIARFDTQLSTGVLPRTHHVVVTSRANHCNRRVCCSIDWRVAWNHSRCVSRKTLEEIMLATSWCCLSSISRPAIQGVVSCFKISLHCFL